MRSNALSFIKRMYDKDQLRDYIERFALNYMQLLVHPNPPSMFFGADKDIGNQTKRDLLGFQIRVCWCNFNGLISVFFLI